MNKAEHLLRIGLHVADVIKGYDAAASKAAELIEGLSCWTTAAPGDATAAARDLRASVASKEYGCEDKLAALVAGACTSILPSNPAKFNTDNIRVCKVPGGSLLQSTVVRGFALGRPAEGTVKHVKNAKIAVFAGRVDIAEMETKGTVLIKNAEELVNYNDSEERQMERAINEIADAGVTVIVTGSGFSELAMHFIEKRGMLAFKCMSKFDMRRLCRAVGANPLVRLGTPTAEEIGYADSVDTDEVGSTRVTTFINETEASKISTIVLRSSTQNHLENLERVIDDGVNVFKGMTRDPRWTPGAGATELELARLLSRHADTLPGLEQYAFRAFAEAFEIVPRTLAENSGQDAPVVIAAMYAAHEAGNAAVGVNVDAGGTIDASEAAILDLLANKANAIRLATEAATTVLKVDQIIMAKRAGGPKPPKTGARDAE
jgi:T-complex protein 1 subunit theta